VPASGDAYILSRVIHDWDDTAALTILGNCRRAIRSDGRLLVIEGVSKPPNEPDPNKFLDVWFIGGGGCERTEAEYGALLHRGGFELIRVAPRPAPMIVTVVAFAGRCMGGSLQRSPVPTTSGGGGA
jgi:hypothetical protein